MVAANPLPSWKDGPARWAILELVARVTRQGGGDLTSPPERIATFDNVPETRALVGESKASDIPPLIRITSGSSRPPDTHVAISPCGSWFWIDGSDAVSKRPFLIAQILLSLTDTSNSSPSPLVAIPAE